MNEKRSYQKPMVTQVDLKPEEAVLTACKSETSAGAAYSLTCGSGKGACKLSGS